MSLAAASLILVAVLICTYFFTARSLGLRLARDQRLPPPADSTSARQRIATPKRHVPIMDTADVAPPANDESSSTPKASAINTSRIGDDAGGVPSISLNEPSVTDSRPPPKPAPSAAQLMPPPAAPPPKSPKRVSPGGSSLAASAPMPLPQRSASLRAPTTASVPNRTASLAPNPRAPPQRTSSVAAATSSTLPAPKRPRQKVVLSPGHSPLDWAQLMTTTPSHELAGVPTLLRVTPSQLMTMNGRKGQPVWSAFGGKVYNIGPYVPFHPGGEGELKRGAGKVGDKLFDEVHPWVNVDNMLKNCLVGILVAEAEEAGPSDLEAMD